MKLYQIKLPEYTIGAKPDYMAIGKPVDKLISECMEEGTYVVRAIGSSDHPNKSRDKLVDIILKTGTDKYDPSRKEVGDFSGYDHDFQGSILTIKEGQVFGDPDDLYDSVFGDIIFHFYEHTPIDRGYAVRIDILLIYFADQLEPAQFVDPTAKRALKKHERYLYKFKDTERKVDALAGVVKIL